MKRLANGGIIITSLSAIDNRIISYKQVNGHFVVVEQINRNKSEFIFKTMFKEKGDYKNAPDYKKNIKEND